MSEVSQRSNMKETTYVKQNKQFKTRILNEKSKLAPPIFTNENFYFEAISILRQQAKIESRIQLFLPLIPYTSLLVNLRNSNKTHRSNSTNPNHNRKN